MKRKPRYYVDFAIVGKIADAECVGKSDKRLYTFDDLEFWFRLANPFYADEWMLAAKMLRRRESTVIKVRHENGIQGIRITRF